MESCVWVTWNGPSGGDAFVARSGDGGATWTRSKVVDSDRYYFAYDGDVTSDGTVVLAQSSISYSGPGGAPAGVVKHHALVSDDGGDSWRNVVVDAVRIGVPCVSVACPSDYYIGHSSVAADDDREAVLRIRRGAAPGDTPTHVRIDIGRRRRHVVGAGGRLGATRAVGVPGGRGHGVG